MLRPLGGQTVALGAQLGQFLLQLLVQLVAVGQFDVADRDLLLVAGHRRRHPSLQFVGELRAQQVGLVAPLVLDETQLPGQFLAVALELLALLQQTLLQFGVLPRLAFQGLLQAEHFAAQDVQLPAGVLFAPGQFLFVLPGEPGQALLLLPGQGGELLSLLLDQLRQARRLLVLLLARRLRGRCLRGGGTGGVPLLFGGHLQPLRLHRGRLFVHQQAQLVAPERVADEHEMVASGAALRVPEVHLVPGHRALAATGQADRPAAHVGAASGAVAQRQVPAGVGAALLVEIEIEEHRRPRLQARIDQHIGQVHLPVGVFRHAHQAIEQRLEFGIQHFLADAAVVEEQHGLRHLWLFLHAHR